MEEDDFVSSHRKARSRHGKEREWGGESKPRGGHLPLGDAPISNSAA